MPTALTRLIARLPFEVSPPPPAYLAAVAVAFIALAAGVTNAQVVAPTRNIAPLYPQSRVPVVVEDTPQYTVVELVESLPTTERFGILLSNTGVLDELDGPGPYTVFAPANNYFDYLPYDAYVGATRATQRALAQRHIISGLAVPLGTEGTSTYLTLGGGRVEVSASWDGSASIGLPGRTGGGFIIRGYRARNGVVYVTNSVLVPQLQ